MTEARSSKEISISWKLNRTIDGCNLYITEAMFTVGDRPYANVRLELPKPFARARNLQVVKSSLLSVSLYFRSGEQKTIKVDQDTIDFHGNMFSSINGRVRSVWQTILRNHLDIICGDLIEFRPEYIGPHRVPPEPIYVASSDDKSRDYTYSVIRRVYTGTVSLEAINKFASSLGFTLKIDAIDDDVFRIKVIPSSHEARQDEKTNLFKENGVSLNSVGFGLVHLLPIIEVLAEAQDYNPDRRRAIVLEQPVAHLHPKFHAIIADVIAGLSKSLPNIYFFVETHSDHFLSRIERHCKKRKLMRREDVSLLYIEQDEVGVARIDTIKTDELGNIQWPYSFIQSKIEDRIANSNLDRGKV